MPGNWGFDFENDFDVADGWELVEIWQAQPDGSFLRINTPAVDPQPLHSGRALREIPKRKTTGMIENVDCIWHLKKANWPTLTRLGVGDVVKSLDDGREWVLSTGDDGHVFDAWVCQSSKAVGESVAS